MKPLRLYMENFLCHENSFIDITQFSSALIVAKIANNDLRSNGAGKTSIFKAIEYVLFNQADVNLEKLVRDDSLYCKVTMDVEIDNKEYRISRSRTRKGNSDLTLLERTSEIGEHEEVYGTNVPLIDKKFWKDISGRRAADTEKDLFKLVKLNFKAFRSTIHFLQNDFGGLTTATPEKRKGILKEALNLVIYNKLEKLAKEESQILSKQIDKEKILLDNIGDPDSDIKDMKDRLQNAKDNLNKKSIELDDINIIIANLTQEFNECNNTLNQLASKNSEAKNKEKELLLSKSRLESSIKEYHSKKSNISKAAHTLVSEIKSLKENQLKLIALDFSQADVMHETINAHKHNLTLSYASVQNNISKLEELNIPMPDNASCKHCRQSLSKEHKQNCKDQISKEKLQAQEEINKHKKIIEEINSDIIKINREINSLQLSKQKLENINSEISGKNKELLDKKSIHDEYCSLLEKFSKELVDKNLEIEKVKLEINNSSIEEENKIKEELISKKEKIAKYSLEASTLNKLLTHFNSEIAVISHSLIEREKDLNNRNILLKSLEALNKKFNVYPLVLQAFSSSGIPNLIIQNVLDDLQIESNKLLSQLKPDLQLSFVIEKTKGDGTQDDTLDINYLYNGKERDYEQLSGAMKLAVTFSLKLGLSFLLQNMIGTNIKFLLLDEIDQSLDKASVDAFADIVKFFQKDFTILIITHNDRLKDKFSHAILVEQDINNVSSAKVVSSW